MSQPPLRPPSRNRTDFVDYPQSVCLRRVKQHVRCANECHVPLLVRVRRTAKWAENGGYANRETALNISYRLPSSRPQMLTAADRYVLRRSIPVDG